MARVQAWFPFVARAWLSDEQLIQCSPATRGIWIDAIATMHTTAAGGRLRGTLQTLARQCRSTPEEMRAALLELRATATADVTENPDGTWTLVSRRLRREFQGRAADAARKKAARAREKSGGESLECPGASPGDASNTQTLGNTEVAGGCKGMSGPSPGEEASERPPQIRADIDHHSPQSQLLDFTDLAAFLLETTGKALSAGDLESLAEEASADLLVRAVEFRAEQGRAAFASMYAGPLAALRKSIADQARASAPGGFDRWVRARAARVQATQAQAAQAVRLKAALEFAARPREERAAICTDAQAAGVELGGYEDLAQATSSALAQLLKMSAGDRITLDASRLEDFAASRAGVTA